MTIDIQVCLCQEPNVKPYFSRYMCEAPKNTILDGIAGIGIRDRDFFALGIDVCDFLDCGGHGGKVEEDAEACGCVVVKQ